MVHKGEEEGDFTVGVQLGVQTVHLDKPIAVGMVILDLRKRRMQEFHYGYMLPKYGAEKIDLMFTDTDSLCYHVRTEDLYKDQQENSDYLARVTTRKKHEATTTTRMLRTHYSSSIPPTRRSQVR
jgi:hypothetical protein